MMKLKILLLLCLAAGALCWGVATLMNRPPDGTRRIPVRGDEAAAIGKVAVSMIATAKNGSTEDFLRRCANPRDGELSMFYRALKKLELATEEPLTVEAFYDAPTRFSVFLALAGKNGRGQMVLSRDPDSGDWYFERFYILQ